MPLHPLVVHAVVVLGPLAALTGLVYAAVPKWRWLLRWPLVVLAVVVAVTALTAVAAGEDLLASRPRTPARPARPYGPSGWLVEG